MRLSKIKDKIVVNSNTGEMLGYVNDLEIDLKTYHIKSIVVEEKGGLLSFIFPMFCKGKIIVIDVKHIFSIGNDVILIENDKYK